ncbi:unnamed protein product [Phytomonas sp. EM1]|nr:unnamed protein product [Phytomonas sp. EM1]|eukprot:CCW62139.1 unnamed protein product [Phytomonas sp. isolate EM1]
MRRTCLHFSGFLQNLKTGTDKFKFFTTLWNKPETKDERIKEYIPEVLEESLQEQRRVIQESTSRDVIVESGHRVLLEIEKKSPTPNILPHLSKLMLEYGAKNFIALRPLSYLLYPSSLTPGGDKQPHDLILTFVDNFRQLIEEVEQNGCSPRLGSAPLTTTTSVEIPKAPIPVPQPEAEEGFLARKEASDAVSDTGPAKEVNCVENTSGNPHVSHSENPNARPTSFVNVEEPTDITMFVKVVTGMALANLHCGDISNAIHCVDISIAHAIDSTRRGALLGLKAGLLVRQKKFKEAVEVAKLAVEVSGDAQGYLHGAYALRMLKSPSEAIALLEKGMEEHPMDTSLVTQLEAAGKEVRLSLPVS